MKIFISSWALLVANAAAFSPASTARRGIALTSSSAESGAGEDDSAYFPPQPVNLPAAPEAAAPEAVSVGTTAATTAPLAPPLPVPEVQESADMTSLTTTTTTSEPPQVQDPATATPLNEPSVSQPISATEYLQQARGRRPIPGLGLAKESDFALTSVGLGGSGTYNQAWLTTPARTSANLEDCMMTIEDGMTESVPMPMRTAPVTPGVATTRTPVATKPLETITTANVAAPLAAPESGATTPVAEESTPPPETAPPPEPTAVAPRNKIPMPKESEFALSSVGLGGSGTYNNGWLTTPARTSAGLDDCMMTIDGMQGSIQGPVATKPLEPVTGTTAEAVAPTETAPEGQAPPSQQQSVPLKPQAPLRKSDHFTSLQNNLDGKGVVKEQVAANYGGAKESDFALSSVGLGGSGTYNNGWLTTPARTSANLEDCMMTIEGMEDSLQMSAPETAPPTEEKAPAVSNQEGQAPPPQQSTPLKPQAPLRKSEHFSSLQNNLDGKGVVKERVAATYGGAKESDFALSSVGLGGSGTYNNGWLTTPARTSANLEDCMMTIENAFDESTSTTPPATVVQKVLSMAATESEFATSSVGLGGAGSYPGWINTPARLSAGLDDCMMTIPMSYSNVTEQDHQDLIRQVMAMSAAESDFITSSVGLGGARTYNWAWLNTPARTSANLEDCMMTGV